MINRFQRITLDDYFDMGGYPFLVRGISQTEDQNTDLAKVQDERILAPTKIEGLRSLQGLFAQLMGEKKFDPNCADAKKTRTESGNWINNLMYNFENGMHISIPIAIEANGLEKGDVPYVHNNALIGPEVRDQISISPVPFVYEHVIEYAYKTSLTVDLSAFSMEFRRFERDDIPNGLISSTTSIQQSYHACSGGLQVKFTYNDNLNISSKPEGEEATYLKWQSWKLEKTWTASRIQRTPKEEVTLTLYGQDKTEYVCTVRDGVLNFPEDLEDPLAEGMGLSHLKDAIVDYDLVISNILAGEPKPFEKVSVEYPLSNLITGPVSDCGTDSEIYIAEFDN